ncbi:phosphatidylinositol 4-phosphate 3-kinase C2 domain-containing subunit alpha-like protein [Lates japonicus]|uniref:Phosphatidylinositol 4-phosphate 3-kinase C2 domain-containing subunit alpha-like protein n=1 Tax=Lates japonicus TaxID=270547 RepID=A0AAD3N676_LATJO|nr:phosphatidylinositol 4-phosphate 3-kinase C2 domain-containing subunit alpha-like protein [Lates japonicus]
MTEHFCRQAQSLARKGRALFLLISATGSTFLNHDKGKGKGLVKNAALEEQDAQNLEVVAFCEDIATLRSKFPHSDMSTNPGFVLSPVITQRDGGGDNSCSVKVSIEISESQQPVTFTCDGKHPWTKVFLI